MYKLIATETFRKNLKKHSKNHELVNELDKKLQKLKERPNSVGKRLSGALHSYKSTRISTRFRLIFSIKDNSVFLEALDHRGKID